MERRTLLKLIDIINRSGIESGIWGILLDMRDTNTIDYFGTEEYLLLNGDYIYVYTTDEDRILRWDGDEIMADYMLHVDGEYILLFQI